MRGADWVELCDAERDARSCPERNLCFLITQAGFVDSEERVRYAFEFTQLELLHPRGTDKPLHGRRKASYPRTRFFRVVQPTGRQGAARRLCAGPRLHDHAA